LPSRLGSSGYIVGAFAREKGEPDIDKFTLTLRKDSSSIPFSL